MGIKDYIEKKKEGFEKWKQKRAEKDAEKERTMALQAKLDREGLKVDAMEAEVRLKELKQMESEKAVIAKTKEYEERNKPPSKFETVVTNVSKGISSFRGGVDKQMGLLSDAASQFQPGSSSKGKSKPKSMFGSSLGSSESSFGGSSGIGINLSGLGSKRDTSKQHDTFKGAGIGLFGSPKPAKPMVKRRKKRRKGRKR